MRWDLTGTLDRQRGSVNIVGEMLRMEPGGVLRSGLCSCDEDKVLPVERPNNWGFFELKKCLLPLPFGNKLT